MQLSSGSHIPDGLLAAMTLRNENSRLGVPTKNPALHQGIDASKSKNAMGLQTLTTTTRVRSRCTGKERDTETGNDYMFARYYNSATGRFLSPDWSAKHEPVPYAKLDSPQSLNLYGYVRNNPLSRTDADGHVDWSALGKGFAEVGRSLTIEASAGFGVGVKSSSLPGGGSFVGVGVFASSSGTKGIGAGYKADATVSQGQASGSQTARVYTMKDGEPIPVHDMQVEKDLPETKLGPVSTNGKEVIVGAEVGEGLSVGGQLSVDKELAKKGWDDMKASLKSAPPAAPAAPKKDQPDPKN